MAKVIGVGRVFLKARDPAALRSWHSDMLGVEIQDWGRTMLGNERANPTFSVWSA